MINKKTYLLISFLAMVFSYPTKGIAQDNSEWKLLKLNVAGATKVNGVEVFAQVNTCKDEDVVYVKFINHNTYPVIVKWFDAVQTKDNKWIKNDDPAYKKSLAIDANKELKGDCLSDSYIECIIKLKEFIGNPDNFYQYATFHFEVLTL